MKAKTLDDLIVKYPKIFKLLNERYYRISSDIPDAWVPTIDNLCECIQSTINNRLEHNKHLEPYPQLEVEQIKEKFGGLRLYYRLVPLNTSKWVRFKRRIQYKLFPEVFSNKFEGMIGLAETILWNTCERCGSTEGIITTKGWISRICKKCNNENTA